MLTLFATALAAQVYAKDFAFMVSQEAWVHENRPQGASYTWYVSKAVHAEIDAWFHSDAERRDSIARLVASGPDSVRPMWWASHAADRHVAYYSQVVLNRLRLCTICKGSGECPGFEGEDVPSGSCKHCNVLMYRHDAADVVRECNACRGNGYDMTIPGDYKP